MQSRFKRSFIIKPTLSICIPTYNRPKILLRTIQNLISQNLFGVEIVISDNASGDIQTVENFCINHGIKFHRNSENFGFTYN
jgi:glycosyltransferase involved in cell wall biosynthesis